MLLKLRMLIGLAPRVQPGVLYLPTIRQAEARRAARIQRPEPDRRDRR